MKKYILTIIAASSLLLAACATYSANVSTTAGSPNATVDNAGPIAAGASVSSANTAAKTTVSSISSTNLVINPAATATGTVPAVFKNTVAIQFAQDEVAYSQTIGSALQTVIPLISNASTASDALNQVATTWGLEPSNPAQQTVYTNIKNDLAKASSSATLLENFLTGLQTNGAVVTASASMPQSKFQMAASLRPIYGWRDAYNVQLATR